MPDLSSEALSKIAFEATALSKQRAVILSGLGVDGKNRNCLLLKRTSLL